MPNPATYLFVDGEYLRRIHGDAMRGFFGPNVSGELELSTPKHQADASRVFFYDSIDDSRRGDETDEDQRARIAPLEDFFARIRIPGLHIRLGTVTGKGKRRRQKEVDILLAVDMLTHGFNGSMRHAVLLAGDLDFRPIIEALVRHGVFVEVWYDRTSIAQDLPGAADFGREIRFAELYSWNTKAFREAHGIPHVASYGGDPSGTFLKSGTLSGQPMQLHTAVGTHGPFYLLWILVEPRTRSWTLIQDTDFDLIQRFVATQYGASEWEWNAEDIRGRA
jgi:uncharacterized LabA/DUF88 family protein